MLDSSRTENSPAVTPPTTADWPAEVAMIISALEAGDHPDEERRSQGRLPYRVLARLTLFADLLDQEPRVLYVRDASPRGVSFLTRQRLPLGYGGTIEIPSPAGTPSFIPCTILRCRVAVGEWFEGAVHFNRDQWIFTPQ